MRCVALRRSYIVAFDLYIYIYIYNTVNNTQTQQTNRAECVYECKYVECIMVFVACVRARSYSVAFTFRFASPNRRKVLCGQSKKMSVEINFTMRVDRIFVAVVDVLTS